MNDPTKWKAAALDGLYNRIAPIAQAMGGSTTRFVRAVNLPNAVVATPRTEGVPTLRAEMRDGVQVDFIPTQALGIGNALSVQAIRTIRDLRMSDWTFTYSQNVWRRSNAPLSDDEIRECLRSQGPPLV